MSRSGGVRILSFSGEGLLSKTKLVKVSYGLDRYDLCENKEFLCYLSKGILYRCNYAVNARFLNLKPTGTLPFLTFSLALFTNSL